MIATAIPNSIVVSVQLKQANGFAIANIRNLTKL